VQIRSHAGDDKTKAARYAIDPTKVYEFLTTLFAEDVHAQRVFSLATGVGGVMHAAAASIHAIGLGLAAATGRETRHAIKQVDRLLSNRGVKVWDLFALWVRFVPAIGRKQSWRSTGPSSTPTDRPRSRCISLRRTDAPAPPPLMWLTVESGYPAGLHHGGTMADDDESSENEASEPSLEDIKAFFDQEVQGLLERTQAMLDELRATDDDDAKSSLQATFEGNFNQWSRRVTPDFFRQFPTVKPNHNSRVLEIIGSVLDTYNSLPVKVGNVDLKNRFVRFDISW